MAADPSQTAADHLTLAAALQEAQAENAWLRQRNIALARLALAQGIRLTTPPEIEEETPA